MLAILIALCFAIALLVALGAVLATVRQSAAGVRALFFPPDHAWLAPDRAAARRSYQKRTLTRAAVSACSVPLRAVA